MESLRRYALVYREFLSTCLSEATSYRAHFLLLIGMELVFWATTLATIDFLYAHVERVGIWNRPQFLFFTCFALTVNHLHMTFVSEGFWIFGENLKKGDLDYDLLKPLHLFLTVFFRRSRPACMLLLPVPWIAMTYFGLQAGLPLWAWVVLPGLVLASFLLMVSFEILLASSMFVTLDGTGINFLRMQLQSVSRWPDFIYAELPRRFFSFVLPVLLISNAPVRFLFDPTDSLGLLLLLPLTGILFWIDDRVWRWFLARYQSASS